MAFQSQFRLPAPHPDKQKKSMEGVLALTAEQTAETAKATAETNLQNLQTEFDNFKKEAGDSSVKLPGNQLGKMEMHTSSDMFNTIKDLL